MPDVPSVDALVLADNVILDKMTGKYSCIGIFKCFWTDQFPVVMPGMSIWGRLNDVWENLHMYLSVNRPSPEGEYGSAIAVQEIDIPGDKGRKDGNGFKEFGGRLVGLQFQKPGRHMVVVATADQVLGYTVFDVGRLETRPVPK